MASLLGKADATLVSAAFREGQSRVGADLSGVYKKREENIKNYRDQVDKLSRHDAYGQFTDLAGEFDRSEVHVDEDAQYRANMALASSLQIDVED